MWNAHVLHASQDDPCPECAINQRHADRWAAALALGPVSDTQARALGEQHRQDWIAWGETPKGPVVKHDKLKKIKAFVVAHHGDTVTIQQIMDEIEASQGTAYTYVREMSLAFRRVGTSTYLVTDRDRVRTETLTGSGARIAQDAFGPAAAMVTADHAEIGLQRPIGTPSKP